MRSGRCRFTRRRLLGLLAAGLGLAPRLAHADPWATADTDTYKSSSVGLWVRTADSNVSIRAGADASAERLRLARSGTVLRVVGVEGDWTQVYDPRADMSGYVHADLLVPSAAPSAFASLPELPLENELETVVIATSDLPLYSYPSTDPLAEATTLAASDREQVLGTVTGEDGDPWFKTQDGYYLPHDGLFVAAAAAEFDGRWLEVTLSGAAHVVAREGDVTVRSFYAIKGTPRYPTPQGTWSIVRRVANETMDSATVGIPRTAPGGYYLKNVLYTQYFRGSGESLHYNWWSSAWGTQGSHGCLGLSLADSRWLWDWASIGTPVSIRA
jgi:L,D-transpeptidase catalytic domain/Bacterial SH3 domain